MDCEICSYTAFKIYSYFFYNIFLFFVSQCTQAIESTNDVTRNITWLLQCITDRYVCMCVYDISMWKSRIFVVDPLKDLHGFVRWEKSIQLWNCDVIAIKKWDPELTKSMRKLLKGDVLLLTSQYNTVSYLLKIIWCFQMLNSNFLSVATFLKHVKAKLQLYNILWRVTRTLRHEGYARSS